MIEESNGKARLSHESIWWQQRAALLPISCDPRRRYREVRVELQL